MARPKKEPETDKQKDTTYGVKVADPIGKNIRGTDQKSRDRAAKLQTALNKAINGKSQADERIVENDRWYRSQHWDVMKANGTKSKAGDPEPTSSYLWNTLANRHGDLMDAFPEPVFFEREESDKEEADKLNKVVKVILERQKFNSVYSRNAWYKVKAGTSCYGVFWDQSIDNGIGDITVKKIDILRLFWESGVEDIQDSKYVFLMSLIDAEDLKKQFPNAEAFIAPVKDQTFRTYNETDQIDTEDKALVVDCYYKEINDDGQTVVHMDKMTNGILIDSTKWEKDGSDQNVKGLYWHGKYPFVFDVMFPEEHSILGFGLVDIIKNPQMYIDKLDQILTKNALVAGKYRIIVKSSGGIKPEDLADLSKDVIMADGNLKEGEDYAVLQAEALPTTIMQHRQQKILELKEVSGANDFNRGNSGGGITAASAIMALQEAGNKLSRAMVAGTYDACSEIYYMIMELIAQFYDDARSFRITNDDGDEEYIEYDNQGLKETEIPSEIDGGTATVRKPILDVKAHAEKQSPYASIARNQMAKEMFGAGMFNPENIEATLITLQMMTFDGKEVVEQRLRDMLEEQKAIQQAQMEAQQEMAGNKQIIEQMDQYIQKLTGKSMLDGANIGQEADAQAQQEQGGQMQ